MNQFITTYKSISLTIKRDDLLHPLISGNKFRKLKYNILAAKAGNYKSLVTFGGAYSNHILATAAAAKENGWQSIGIIRGEELEANYLENPTLNKAHQLGMQFIFVSRADYQHKENVVAELNLDPTSHYIIPEGGTNLLAIKGCEEILDASDKLFDYVCCSVGTGGTISGIINSSNVKQQIIGFSSLKGDFLSDEIRKFVTNTNWTLNSDYHFGGYGKVSDELIDCINEFKDKHGVLLDPIYTGKMIFGVMDLIDKDYFTENSSILLIHTGGLQGISGINKIRKKNNKSIIQL